MADAFHQADLISLRELTLEDIQAVLTLAAQYKKNPPKDILKNKLIAQCFFEPSTRTRLSFEAATLRLGGQNIGFTNAEGLSIQKGESFEDTIKVIAAMADAIILRHPKEGSARLAAEISDKPVINAGDGANQHPTQALLDLFTIQETQGKIDGLSIALVGDLKYGRTIHSLTQAFELFDVRLYLVSPDNLSLPESICDRLKKHGVRFSFHQTLEEVIPKVDVLYSTRIQQERFNKAENQLIKEGFILTPMMLEKAKGNLKIMHPLPRLNEIAVSVDNMPHAYYFQQAANGVCVRQALLSLILGGK